jgi:hypothetical protein
MNTTRALGLFLACMTLTACSWAPPNRSVHLGAPGLVGPHEVALQASTSDALQVMDFSHWNGAFAVQYPIGHGLHLEGATDLSRDWWMSSAGVRFTHKLVGAAESTVRRGLYFDIDGGFSGGVGGDRTEYQDSTGPDGKPCGLCIPHSVGSTWTNGAFGMHGGVGLGGWITNEFALFARGQAQTTWANGTNTQYLSALGGVQVRVAQVGGYCGLGVWSICREGDCFGLGELLECGLSVSFPQAIQREVTASMR